MTDGRTRGVANTQRNAETPEDDDEPSDDEINEVIDCLFEHAFEAHVSEVEGIEPATTKEAMSLPTADLWMKAQNEEIEALVKAETWTYEHPPQGATVLGARYIYKLKRDAAGNIVRYKARLVAQGFSQVPGVDYFDTYAPVAKLASIRAVLAIAARQNLELQQIDIKSAYLNGELHDDEVIYMKPPPGFVVKSGKMLRLRKTLYGLKQSGRRWYQKLTWIFVDQCGLTRSDVDQAVFYRHVGNELIVVVVHVDDCTIGATTPLLAINLKKNVMKHVEITDLGELHWLLGIEVRRDRARRTISLSQASYIDAILRRYNLQDLKPVSIPMDPNARLHSEQRAVSSKDLSIVRTFPYREALGSLQYLSLGTRPDITFAVSILARFAGAPGVPHVEGVKRVYRYINGTRDLWLTYGEEKKDLVGYGDADGSMQEDRHAISGNAFLIDGGAVSWYSKKQEIISLSTTESEYVAATHAAKEAIWLRQLLGQIFGSFNDSTVVYCDNQSAIALTKDHQFHARTKHIDVRFHFIRWIIEQGLIKLVYCPTAEMVADVLTKALPSLKVKHFAAALGLRSA